MILSQRKLPLPDGAPLPTVVAYSTAHRLIGLYPAPSNSSRPGVSVFHCRDHGFAQFPSTLVRDAAPSALAFHPILPVLAVGGEDGSVLLWKAKEAAASGASLVHSGRVTHARFTDNGSRLVTCSEDCVVVWEVDVPKIGPPTLRRMNVVPCPSPPVAVSLRAYDQTGLAPAEDSDISAHCAVACKDGSVIAIDDSGRSDVTMVLESAALLYLPSEDLFIHLSSSGDLSKLEYSVSGFEVSDPVKLSLSGVGPIAASWCGAGVVAVSASGTSVRCIDIDTLASATIEVGAQVASMTYCPVRHILMIEKSAGGVAAYENKSPLPHTQQMWVPAGTFHTEATDSGVLVLSPVQGPAVHAAPAGSQASVSLIEIRHPAAAGCPVSQLALSQTSQTGFTLSSGQEVTSPIPFSLASVSGDVVAVAGARDIVFFTEGQATSHVRRQTDTVAIGVISLDETCLLVASGKTLDLITRSGAQLARAEASGRVVALAVRDSRVVVADSVGNITIFEVTQSALRKMSTAPLCLEPTSAAYEASSLALSHEAKYVACAATQRLSGGDRVPAPLTFVINVEDASVVTFDSVSPAHAPVSVAFDKAPVAADPRLLCVVERAVVEDFIDDAESFELGLPGSGGINPVVTVGFVDEEFCPLYRGCAPVGGEFAYFSPPFVFVGERFAVPDLSGLPTTPSDSATQSELSAYASDRSGLLAFSHHVATGDVSSALASTEVQLSPAMWRSLLSLCVTSRRLDVALQCLTAIGDVVTLAAAREAVRCHLAVAPESMFGPHGPLPLDSDSRLSFLALAEIAISVGLVHEAEQLLADAGRHDLVVSLRLSQGDAKGARRYAARKCAGSSALVEYHLAERAEMLGDPSAAAKHLSSAGAASVDVARALVAAGDMKSLSRQAKENTEIARWRARLMESQGDVDGALAEYKRIGDVADPVRLTAASQGASAAIDLVTRSAKLRSNPLAVFQLARLLEAKGEYGKAATRYAECGCVPYALRLAMKSNQVGTLVTLAKELKPFDESGARLTHGIAMLHAVADWFAEHDDLVMAAQLYTRGGAIDSALEICERGNLHDALVILADNLPPNAPPQTLLRLGELLLKEGHVEQAVVVLAAAKEYRRGLALCLKHRITLSDELVEKLTPPKGTEARLDTLSKLGTLLKAQGQFATATRLFTQAGDRVTAMHCLVRTGDVKRVVLFANVSRDPAVFTIAANFLQSLPDWHSRPEISKTIAGFYAKARAWLSLARYYDNCARIEIDEYRDYSKAGAALSAVVKILGRVSSAVSGEEEEMHALLGKAQTQCAAIERFAAARASLRSDPAQTVQTCHELLASPREVGVRPGDVHALLVELYVNERQYGAAHRQLSEMLRNGLELQWYVDADKIELVEREVGAKVSGAVVDTIDEDNEEEIITEDFSDF